MQKVTRALALEPNPFLWLATRERRSRLLAWTLVGTIVPFWGAFMFGTWSPRWKDPALLVSLVFAYGLHLLLKCIVATEASRRFSDDQQSGAMELLLVTPLPPGKIVEGQRQALWRTFRGAIVAVCGVNAITLEVILLLNPANMPWEPQILISVILLGGALLLPLDCRALAWVGMCLGLSGRRHHRAVFGTLGRVMLAPWAGMLLFFYLGFSGAFKDENLMYAAIACWFLFSAGIDLFTAFLAKRAVTQRFRRLARGARFEEEGLAPHVRWPAWEAVRAPLASLRP
jgi:hypothetical protein